MSKKLRAVLYARYSTKKQREVSIEDQFRICTQLATQHGFEVVQKFSDKGISGGTTKRPGYLDMLEFVRAREADVIVAEDMSRLWRNMAEQSARLAEIADLRIHLVTRDIDSRTESASFTGAVLGASSTLYRKEIGRRTRRALEGRAMKNQTTGGRAYGYIPAYKSETKQIEVDPVERKVVRRIYEMRAAGQSAKHIARTLNTEKVPAPGAHWVREDSNRNPDSAWRPSAIGGDPAKGTGILNNPIYRGQVAWGRSVWIRSETDSSIRKPEPVPRDKWIVHEVPRLRIVTDELWNRVYELQTARSETRDAIRRGMKGSKHGRKPSHWLGGVTVCDECGSNFIANGLRDYICPSHDAGNCKNDLRFRRDDIHGKVFDLIKQELLSPARIARTQKQYEAELRTRQKELTAAARKRVPSKDLERLDETVASLRKMSMPLGAFNAAMTELTLEREAIIARSENRDSEAVRRTKLMIAALPDFARRYREKVNDALSVLGGAAKGAERVKAIGKIEDAREATQKLLADGRIRLRRNAAGNALSGPVHLQRLGNHLVEVGASRRNVHNGGSGGRI